LFFACVQASAAASDPFLLGMQESRNWNSKDAKCVWFWAQAIAEGLPTGKSAIQQIRNLRYEAAFQSPSCFLGFLISSLCLPAFREGT
jgi:hypothetical protein